MDNKGPQVRLAAYSSDGQLVVQLSLTHGQFYEDLHPIIDSDEYRRERRIVRITGEVYSPSGLLDQQFTNHYAADGSYASGRAVHADGTVIQD